jgi:hypothetical protein
MGFDAAIPRGTAVQADTGRRSLIGRKGTVDLGEVMEARETALRAAGLEEDPSASLMRGK